MTASFDLGFLIFLDHDRDGGARRSLDEGLALFEQAEGAGGLRQRGGARVPRRPHRPDEPVSGARPRPARRLERAGRRVVNGSRVVELEVSEVRQHAALRAAGIDVPCTVAVVGRDELIELARHLGELLERERAADREAYQPAG